MHFHVCGTDTRTDHSSTRYVFVFVLTRNMNQWTEMNTWQETKPVTQGSRNDNRNEQLLIHICKHQMFDNAIKMANLMRRMTSRKSWERNEKRHSAVPSLSGSCDLTAGSDITFGLTASTSSIKHPQRNGDGSFFLQTPAACSRLARTPVGYTRMGGESETSGESEDGD